ncbi:MAG: YraN family protein [Peptococcaceae bacterium]|jgi:putative endonuclease|nr:YraN family protein [Peptococcaceae bacterium]
MSDQRTALGRAGEAYAAQLLVQAELRILARNYRCKQGEIDIIARDGQHILVFVEVRTRTSEYAGWGEESLTRQKMRKMQTVAQYYVLSQGYTDWPELRFDLIALRWTEQQHPQVRWLKGIF